MTAGGFFILACLAILFLCVGAFALYVASLTIATWGVILSVPLRIVRNALRLRQH